ncbi:hypothetical protein AcW1_008916 [Taiwanofungus camphoratus]|nr:hypothetical protein AcW1_008916 [Antrodia cinnamomea]KAI0958933.1 hypothetical protein AcV7_004613 [Antrodia cinnamomea]
MSDIVYTDVLIIGAGPAGLMAALTLSRLHVDIKIIERRLPHETAGQADGVQPRMLEVWDSLGLGDELRRAGTHVRRYSVYNPNEEGTGIKLTNQRPNILVPTARYPYELLVQIEVMEGILTKTLAAEGVKVDQPVIPQSLKVLENEVSNSDAYPVEVTLVYLDEEWIRLHSIPQDKRDQLISNPEAVKRVEVVQAKYVIGCDGARSWVRRTLGIKMEGDRTEHIWGVIDYTPITDFPSILGKNVVLSPKNGGMIWLPRPNKTVRMYILIQASSMKQNGLNADEIQQNGSQVQDVSLRARIFENIQQGHLPYEIEIKDVTWCNAYKVSQRIASRFSHLNRIFIAGDACHTHSPMAGQGANASMTDSCNLAWKMAYVLRGWANHSLLETYDVERHAYAVDLLKFDKSVFNLIRPESGLLRSDDYTSLWKQSNIFTSGLGLRYESALTVPEFQDLAPALRIGARVPPANIVRCSDWNPFNILDVMPYDGKFRLLVFPGDTSQPAVAQQFFGFAKAVDKELQGHLRKVVEILTVLNVPKETTIDGWQLPACFHPGVKCVGSFQTPHRNLIYSIASTSTMV